MRTCLCLLLLGCLTTSARAANLRAGAARGDITPPLGGPLWGYGARHDSPSTGVRDALQARVLVIEAGKRRVALVGLDLGRAPPRDTTTALEAQARTKLGIDAVFLVASHTHHGPVLEMERWPDVKKPYLRTLQEKLLELLTKAVADLKAAKLGVVSRESTLNRNRHTKLADKPVDRELLVLRVEDADGKAIAHAVNFAAHATTLPAALLKFSADWPGAMTAHVEAETHVPCLFLQGAAGDLSPNTSQQRDTDAFGKAVAAEVLALVKKAKCQSLAEAEWQIEQDAFTFPSRIDLKNQAVKLLFVQAFFAELVAFYDREYRDGIRPRLTTALLDGRIGFVGVSGEFFCSHALNLKRRARLDQLFFLGYCNDYQQYFPTIEAAAEGGYGADAPVSPAEVGAGERMMDRALIHLWKMRGRMPSLPPKVEK